MPGDRACRRRQRVQPIAADDAAEDEPPDRLGQGDQRRVSRANLPLGPGQAVLQNPHQNRIHGPFHANQERFRCHGRNHGRAAA